MEFNSFGPAVGRLGTDSSRGAKVEAGGAELPLTPLTLTTDAKHCTLSALDTAGVCCKLSVSAVFCLDILQL